MFEFDFRGLPIRRPFFNLDGGGGDAGGGTPPADPGAGTSNAGEPPASGAVPTEPPIRVNPLLREDPPAAPAAPTPAPPAQPTEFDFGGRKISVTDPAIAEALKAVHGDYKSLTGTYTQTSQRMKELETQNQQYSAMVQALQSQQAAPAQPPAPEAAPPEEPMSKEDFIDRFYADPEGFFNEQVNKTVEARMEARMKELQPVIEPLQQKQAFENQVKELAGKYEDFGDMIETMEKLGTERPELAGMGLEQLYHTAKAFKAMQPAAPAEPVPSAEQLLSNPEWVKNNILGNEQIQQQILSNYLQNKAGNPAPPLMGGGPGGQAPTVPPTKPTTIRDASKAFLAHLGL